MRLVTGRWTRVLVLAALVAALVLPSSAGAGVRPGAPAVAATGAVRPLAAADDQIPGVALPSSPFSGTLSLPVSAADTSFDVDDVFAVALTEGQTLSAYVSTPDAEVDCELYLYPPEATDIVGDADKIVASAELQYTSPDMLVADGAQFVAPADGTYYLDVYLLDAPSGDVAYDYALTYAIGDETPDVELAASAPTVSYDGAVTFSGVVKDSSETSMAGEPVELWAVGYPYESFTRKATGVTEADGSFTFTTTVTRWTEYKVVCTTDEPGYAWGESDSVWVKAKVALGAPKVYSGTKRAGRAFTVYGYIKPRHPLGQKHVKITAYGSYAGVWRVAPSVSNTATHTKYSTTIVLPYKGKWKLVASTPDDGYHAPTTSSATYVTVK